MSGTAVDKLDRMVNEVAYINSAKTGDYGEDSLVAHLQSELCAERSRSRALELELARAKTDSDFKLEELTGLLQQVLTDISGPAPFNNPNLAHLDKADAGRCWLYADCERAPDIDDFTARMKVCFACEAFKLVAPDKFARAGEIANSLLFLLNRSHEQFHSAREQLIQSERLAGLGELAAGLAHEINTPVGIILARLDCMQLELPQHTDCPLPDDLQVIRRHAERLSRITSSLTSFARRHKIDKHPVSLQELLRELLDIVERMVQNGNITVQADMPVEPMVVFADGTLIQQVYMNLIINARDAMPDGGHLKVSGWADEDRMIMEFRDTGMGISPDVINRIFDPFFSTKEDKGTGLGLSVSYAIIKDHGGAINVTSAEGAGTCFRLSLPRYTPQPTAMEVA